MWLIYLIGYYVNGFQWRDNQFLADFQMFYRFHLLAVGIVYAFYFHPAITFFGPVNLQGNLT